jgi:site-specific recombinase XerD
VTSSIESLVHRLKVRLGIQESISPHKWRHTFATHFLHRGGNLETLRLILGHTNLKTTQKYLHLTKDNVREEYEKIMIHRKD